MIGRCRTCGDPFRRTADWQLRCWDCWRRERDAATRRAGYEEGFLAGWDTGYAVGRDEVAQPALDAGLLRDLVRVSHPDVHPPERRELATRVTARLNAIREAAA